MSEFVSRPSSKPKPARRPQPRWRPSSPNPGSQRAIRRGWDRAPCLDERLPRTGQAQLATSRGSLSSRTALRLLLVLAAAIFLLFAACGCTRCGGEVALVLRPGASLGYLPQSTLIEGPGSASVPFRVETPAASTLESIPPPATTNEATTATSGESPQPPWK